MVQTINVSTKGPNMATKPSRTGSFVLAAPCAIDSVPMPASLLYAPRLTPYKMTAKIDPPATASPVNASVMISANAAGTDSILIAMAISAATT